MSDRDDPHRHWFRSYEVCSTCGQTEAAIEGCHHCNEVTVGKRCWWCLQLKGGDPRLTQLRDEMRQHQDIGSEYWGMIVEVNDLKRWADTLDQILSGQTQDK